MPWLSGAGRRRPSGPAGPARGWLTRLSRFAAAKSLLKKPDGVKVSPAGPGAAAVRPRASVWLPWCHMMSHTVASTDAIPAAMARECPIRFYISNVATWKCGNQTFPRCVLGSWSSRPQARRSSRDVGRESSPSPRPWFLHRTRRCPRPRASRTLVTVLILPVLAAVFHSACRRQLLGNPYCPTV